VGIERVEGEGGDLPAVGRYGWARFVGVWVFSFGDAVEGEEGFEGTFEGVG
jgi:hypothetical protein